MRTSLRPLIAAALAAVLLAACGGSTPAGVAATVNGEEIPRDLVEQIVVAQMSGPQVPPGLRGADLPAGLPNIRKSAHLMR